MLGFKRTYGTVYNRHLIGGYSTLITTSDWGWFETRGGEEDEARQKPNYRDRSRFCCWALLYRTTGSVHTIACDRIGGFDYAVYAHCLIAQEEPQQNQRKLKNRFSRGSGFSFLFYEGTGPQTKADLSLIF